ncbi:Os06g0192300 [Oryza sativa Japonica Group]|uniref:Os06g0192300 protein n=1 Tax=Oryza sativa subsp. japonica TaxID=39947 RepID=A0A0P0WTS7_ORYSJ|nr:hypothetical protein EE612_032418 [Oryza sativa]BAS96582.1 Os06g0192300 [Oryza sativa Japonica Group]
MPVLASDEEVAMPEQRSAVVVLVPPDRRGFIPLADWIRDLSAAFPRIDLDSLVPPAPQPHPLVVREERPSPSLVAGLTVEEAKKVLRATQMETARARRRARAPCHMPSSSGSAVTPPARSPAPPSRVRSTSPDPSSCSARPSSSGPRWFSIRMYSPSCQHNIDSP